MEEMLREYLPILVLLAVAIGLGLVLILAAVVLAVRHPDPEKVSADEVRRAVLSRVDPVHHI